MFCNKSTIYFAVTKIVMEEEDIFDYDVIDRVIDLSMTVAEATELDMDNMDDTPTLPTQSSTCTDQGNSSVSSEPTSGVYK